MASIAPAPTETGSFRHEACFYCGLDDLVRAVVPFVRSGLALGEPVLVTALPDRIAALEAELGADAGRVSFLDAAEVGRNPARILPALRKFVTDHPGRPVRSVGEAVWAGRSRAELDECRLHESLLNLVFQDVTWGFHLLCAYDAQQLPGDVLVDAQRTHPGVAPSPYQAYGGLADALDEFERDLPPAPTRAEEIHFTHGDLAGLRSVVRRICALASLPPGVTDDLVLAANELATNSLAHGGGAGVFRGWREPGLLLMEVSDGGVITDPLVGRDPARPLAEMGRGVWIANQLCDLVQVRSSARGTSVRLHTSL